MTWTRDTIAMTVAMPDRHQTFSRLITPVLEHVRDHGGIQGFPGGRQERLALMKAAQEQGLIVWNKAFLRYDLTTFGQRRLAAFGRESMR
jgi:hypothetical protein